MTTDQSFSTNLLTWFDQHGRKHLPWQTDISPYRVWVSEIMLQQTQVATVIPYFNRFMKRYPRVTDLADASEDDVLHHWTGLGYYARARNLHKTAKIIAGLRQGSFPTSVDELVELPGIGRSTAGAIVSIACGGRAPILDGNVKRVLARCFGIAGWPGATTVARELWEKAEALTPTTRVADYTQAIMDLGATLCTRASPKCVACPFERTCVANQAGRISELPGKKPKREMPVRTTCMLLIQNDANEILLQKRPPEGLWGGLWSFPEATDLETASEMLATRGITDEPTPLAPFRHTFTHFHLDITPLHVQSPSSTSINEPGSRWFAINQPIEVGLTRPVTRLIKLLGN
ncbi:MAG: A/G-specific adenine glycosylase [Pseudomonadota bacterium]